MKKILSIIIIIVLSTILGLAYNASTNLSLRLLEATDDVRPFREDFNYNFELVDDIFDDVSLIEFSYLDGVTSSIQDQIDSVGSGAVDTSGTPVDNDIAVFTDLNTIEGLNYAELKAVLDLEIGTDIQAWDAQLDDISALAYANSNFIVGDGSNWVAESGATARASLGLTIGTNVQAYDAGLLSIAGLTTSANDMIYTTALDTYAIMDTFAELQAVVADKTLVNEEDVFTIDANWVNTANPWADNEVADNITIDLATLATTFTVTDNESEALACPIVFVDGATGDQGAESDDTDFTYNPSTGNLSATQFEGITAANLVDKSATESISGTWTLTTPVLGTPTSGTLTNCTGLPIATGVSGLAANVATFLATPSSSNLASAVTGETGSGALVFGTSPTFTTPVLGTPQSGTLTNCSFPTLNQNTTGSAAILTTARNIGGVAFDGSANIIPNVVTDTTPELGGELDAGAHSIGFTLQTATGDGATLIDWTAGNKMKFTFGAGNETITFTDPSNPCNLLWIIVQDGTGSRTITYSGMTIKWAGGTAPTLTTAADGEDIVSLFFDGSDYYGVASLAFAAP